MPVYNTLASIIQAILAVLVAVVAYRVLRGSLRNLLDQTLKLPDATAFYVRSFLLVLLFVALAQAVSFARLKPESAFMDYLWTVADNIGTVLEHTYVALLVFLTLMTVLVAVLRHGHER